MKRIVLLLTFCLLIVLTLTGCLGEDSSDTLSFNAVVESVDDQSILVVLKEPADFDKASVDLSDVKDLPALEAGDWVFVTILPEIRESYPVQVTAVSLRVLTDEEIESMNYKVISPEDAKVIMEDGAPYVLLDVRTPAEFKEGHIEGALLLPNTEVEAKASSVLPDKDARILVYCRSGNRSEEAALKLIDMGYSNVYDFGGIIDWPYDIVID